MLKTMSVGAIATYAVALAVGCVCAFSPLSILLWRLLRCQRVFSRESENLRPYPRELADARWGRHLSMTANGVRFHVVERAPIDGPSAGPRSAGSGAPLAGPAAPTPASASPDLPIMLCLHGFPESWYSWRYIAYAFSASYRVVMPDLRGYGETALAEPAFLRASDYALATLVEDVRCLVVGLGGKSVTLVAHDWGGMIGWVR